MRISAQLTNSKTSQADGTGDASASKKEAEKVVSAKDEEAGNEDEGEESEIEPNSENLGTDVEEDPNNVD